MLATNAPKRKHRINLSSESLLTGFIYDLDGKRLSPIYSQKPNGRRYRYYVSQSLMQQIPDDGSALRLPASEVESLVIRQIKTYLKSVIQKASTSKQFEQLETLTLTFDDNMDSKSADNRRQAIIDLIAQMKIGQDMIKLTFRPDPFIFLDLDKSELTQSWPLSIKRRGVEAKLVLGGTPISDPDMELITLIAKAQSWWADLRAGTITSQKELADRENLDKGDVSRILKLAFLAPDIVRAILKGRQPIDLTVQIPTQAGIPTPNSLGPSKNLTRICLSFLVLTKRVGGEKAD